MFDQWQYITCVVDSAKDKLANKHDYCNFTAIRLVFISLSIIVELEFKFVIWVQYYISVFSILEL